MIENAGVSLPLFVGTTYDALCFLIATFHEFTVLKGSNGLVMSWRNLQQGFDEFL
jgi:hypothetical protein